MNVLSLFDGMSGGLHSQTDLIIQKRQNVNIVAMRGRGANNTQQLENKYDGKSNCLTNISKDNLVILNKREKENFKNGWEKATTLLSSAFKGPQNNGMTLVSCERKEVGHIRRLTPVECERLQTVKDNYTAHVSDSQRYKMLGNGWNIDTIAHILSYL